MSEHELKCVAILIACVFGALACVVVLVGLIKSNPYETIFGINHKGKGV